MRVRPSSGRSPHTRPSPSPRFDGGGGKAGAQELRLELESAISVFTEAGDRAGQARALGLAGALRWVTGQAAAAIDDLEEAARDARLVGDRALEAECLSYMLLATLWGAMPIAEALKRVEAIRSRGERNRTLDVTVLRTRAELEGMQGQFDAARELVAQAKTLTEELGLERRLGGVALAAAYVELLAGDARAAERELRPACEAAERIGDWSHFATLAPRLAEALLAQGCDEEALRFIRLTEHVALPDDVDPQIAWRRVRAKLLARRGDIEEAQRLAYEATALAARTDLLNERAEALADLAEVLRVAGRPEESAAAVQEAIRLYEMKGNIAAAGNLRGLLAEPPLEV